MIGALLFLLGVPLSILGTYLSLRGGWSFWTAIWIAILAWDVAELYYTTHRKGIK